VRDDYMKQELFGDFALSKDLQDRDLRRTPAGALFIAAAAV
jgi:hypothetical protein